MIVYRTPAAVRAIPVTTWDQWRRERTKPLTEFSAERGTQSALREIVKATMRRSS